MPRLELMPEVVEDLERFMQHLASHEVADAAGRIDAIIEAVDILIHSPSIGRPAGNGLRELVIGRDAQGYVALYRHIPTLDAVFVLAIRHQHESGYAR